MGDLIGFSAYSLTGLIINLGSFRLPFIGLSHIGIVGNYLGRPRLFESTSLNASPCLIQNRCVSGSQVQNLDTRIMPFKGRVYRIQPTRPLSTAQGKDLSAYLIDTVGKPYDYFGAERSGGKLWAQMHRLLHAESAASLFCSEWVALALREINVFHTGNASSWSPNSLYRELRRRDVYSRRLAYKPKNQFTD